MLESNFPVNKGVQLFQPVDAFKHLSEGYSNDTR
jgi:hypothetical protein